MSTIKINGVDVPYSTEVPSINVQAIVSTFKPWKDWCAELDADMHIEHVHFQSVDETRDMIKFVKMKCDVTVGKEHKRIPGIVLLRGPAVGCLIEILCDGKTYALLIEQPRTPSGKCNFREIVAGMIENDTKFAGAMVREVKVC